MMKKQKGFTLIEVIMVIGVMMVIMVMEFQKSKKVAQEELADGASIHLKSTLIQLDNYMNKHMVEFQDMNNGAKYPNVFPVICSPVDVNTCQLDLSVLVREGFFSPEWRAFNPVIKTGYSAYIRRIAPAGGVTEPGDYNLEVFVRTDTPWESGIGSLSALMNETAKRASGKAGVILDGQANGIYGSWSKPIGEYPGMQNGQLAAVLSIGAAFINQYVKLNGEVKTTSAINMGNNRINNIQDIQLLGPSSLPRQGGGVTPMVSDLTPNWVLKGVYSVTDYGSDPGNPNAGVVPLPVCADSDASNGLPRILVKMTALYNEMNGSLSGGTTILPTDTNQLSGTNTTAGAKINPSYGGWNFYALEDTASKTWHVYVRRFYDNGYIPGEALAEVYCFYP